MRCPTCHREGFLPDEARLVFDDDEGCATGEGSAVAAFCFIAAGVVAFLALAWALFALLT